MGDYIYNASMIPQGSDCWPEGENEPLLGSALADCDASQETACPANFWQYDPWAACSATCTGVNFQGQRYKDVTGTRTRDASCKSYNNGVVTDESDESLCGEQESLSEACSIQCVKPVTYVRRNEGACSATACGESGTISVTYNDCTPGTEYCMPVVSKPDPTSIPCAAKPCDACASNNCVAANTASTSPSADGRTCKCTCKDGWAGSRCHYKPSDGPQPVLDKRGVPCQSAVLDRERNCCSNGIDGCGYCKGAGLLLT